MASYVKVKTMFHYIIESITFDRLVNGTKRCCTGFMWNNTIGDCIACPLGYVGLQCEIPCVYPLYGLECQSVCHCSREFCLISTGCIKRVTYAEYYETSGHTVRQPDSTTLDTNDKLTTSDSSSSIFYHTSERSLFNKSDLTPIPNHESFPTVTIRIYM